MSFKQEMNFTWCYEELLSLPKTMNQTDFHHTPAPTGLNTLLNLSWYRQVVNKM